METLLSPLGRQLQGLSLTLPSAFDDFTELEPLLIQDSSMTIPAEVQFYFPHLSSNTLIHFQPSSTETKKEEKEVRKTNSPLKIGVLFSGGQAPGGHNVILGLYEAIKQYHIDSRLIGFLDGPKGVLLNAWKELTEELVNHYKNAGGFDLLGSGRDKIEAQIDLESAKNTVMDQELDGLVIIGGDDSNTNAAVLSEYFSAHHVQCTVVGVPKTIDGDLKNSQIEISFGFDTAAKTYAHTIGSLARDALSAKKYYFFVKIMGRSASHLALEVAIQTHVNLTLISEEIAEKKKTLKQVVNEIADLVCERSAIGKEYGVVLIPEGVIEFIEDFRWLIQEMNDSAGALSSLSERSADCLALLPEPFKNQLFLEKDPHGNIQVSKIESERFFIALVSLELEERKKRKAYSGQFNAQPYFCGYEGRSCAPSLFDAHYCYALGFLCALLVRFRANGYMAILSELTRSVFEWVPKGVPIVSMMQLEKRNAKLKPVVAKAKVNLSGIPYRLFMQNATLWRLEDHYRYVGPIQYFGSMDISATPALTLILEKSIGGRYAD